MSSTLSIESSEIEVPYAMNFSSDEQAPRRRSRRNDEDEDDEDSSDDSGICFESPGRPQHQTTTSGEPLRVGDSIAYTSPAFTAGTNQGRRQATVVGVDPNHTQFPLTLDNCELLPWDTRVRRTGEYCKGSVQPHRGRWKPLTSFALQASGTTSETALGQAMKVRASHVRGALRHIESEAMRAYAGRTNNGKNMGKVSLQETRKQKRPPQSSHDSRNRPRSSPQGLFPTAATSQPRRRNRSKEPQRPGSNHGSAVDNPVPARSTQERANTTKKKTMNSARQNLLQGRRSMPRSSANKEQESTTTSRRLRYGTLNRHRHRRGTATTTTTTTSTTNGWNHPLPEPSSDSSLDPNHLVDSTSEDDDDDDDGSIVSGFRTQPPHPPLSTGNSRRFESKNQTAEMPRGTDGNRNDPSLKHSSRSRHTIHLSEDDDEENDSVSRLIQESGLQKNKKNHHHHDILSNTEQKKDDSSKANLAGPIGMNDNSEANESSPLSTSIDDDYVPSQEIPFYNKDFVPRCEREYEFRKQAKTSSSSSNGGAGVLSFSKSNNITSSRPTSSPSFSTRNETLAHAATTRTTPSFTVLPRHDDLVEAASSQDPSTTAPSGKKVTGKSLLHKSSKDCHKLSSNSFLSCDDSTDADEPMMATTPKALRLVVTGGSAMATKHSESVDVPKLSPKKSGDDLVDGRYKQPGSGAARTKKNLTRCNINRGMNSSSSSSSSDSEPSEAVRPTTENLKRAKTSSNKGVGMKKQQKSNLQDSSSTKTTLDAALGLNDGEEFSSQECSSTVAKKCNPENDLPPSGKSKHRPPLYLDSSSSEDDDVPEATRLKKASSSKMTSSAKRKREEWLAKQHSAKNAHRITVDESSAKKRKLLDVLDTELESRTKCDPKNLLLVNGGRGGGTAAPGPKPKRSIKTLAKDSLYEDIVDDDSDDDEFLMDNMALCRNAAGNNAIHAASLRKENSPGTPNAPDDSQRLVEAVHSSAPGSKVSTKAQPETGSCGNDVAPVKGQHGRARRRLISTATSMLETATGSIIRRGQTGSSAGYRQAASPCDHSLDKSCIQVDIYGNPQGTRDVPLSDSSSASEEYGRSSGRFKRHPRKKEGARRRGLKGEVPSSWSTDCEVDSPPPSPLQRSKKSPVFDFVDETTPKNKTRRIVHS